MIPDATISVHERCEDSFALKEYINESIEIEYRGQYLPQKCKLRFDSDKHLSNICVKSKKFYVTYDASVTVEYHKAFYVPYSPDKVYNSSSLPVIVLSFFKTQNTKKFILIVCYVMLFWCFVLFYVFVIVRVILSRCPLT